MYCVFCGTKVEEAFIRWPICAKHPPKNYCTPEITKHPNMPIQLQRLTPFQQAPIKLFQNRASTVQGSYLRFS